MLVVALVVGALLLAVSADRFVAGAVGFSARSGVSPVLVGAVIIGFGTSAPELVVSVVAAAGGEIDIGVGNVIGSNVANLTVVLGGSALLAPIVVPHVVLRREVVMVVAATVLFAAVAADGRLDIRDAALLAAALVVALAVLARGSSTDPQRVAGSETGEADLAPDSMRRLGAMTFAGLAGTVAGAQILVWGASGVAGEFGLTGGVVGVSLVAVGTSLPEIVTCLSAARRGHGEMVVGNVLGSNLFNALLVGAAMATVSGAAPMSASLSGPALLLLLGVTAAVVCAMVVRRRLGRVAGVLLMAAYVPLILVTA
jgi:cation:H+ antiporter